MACTHLAIDLVFWSLSLISHNGISYTYRKDPSSLGSASSSENAYQKENMRFKQHCSNTHPMCLMIECWCHDLILVREDGVTSGLAGGMWERKIDVTVS